MGFTLDTRESTKGNHVTRETLNVRVLRFHGQGDAQLNEPFKIQITWDLHLAPVIAQGTNMLPERP